MRKLNFAPAVNWPVGTGPLAVVVGDFNGDGKADLAVANLGWNLNGSDGSVSVLLGNGDGTFRPAITYPDPLGPTSVAAGDFNGDGILDLVVAHFDGVSVLLGNGDGTFRPGRSIDLGRSVAWVAVGDFTGNGKLDIAAAEVNNNAVAVLLGNGDGTFQAPVTYEAGPNPTYVKVADFNGDGKPDLLVDNSGSVGVLLGNGDGTFQPVKPTTMDVNTLTGASADFNGDGRSDLAVANFKGNSLSVYLGNGDGTYQPPQDYPVGPGPGFFVAVGDFNGDGKPDLVVADRESNTVSVLLNLGSGDPPSASPDELFVAALYHDVLGRTPDAAGQAGWLAQLRAGASRQAVAQGFWESVEHRGQEVDQFYASYLHRPADAAGRAAWVNAFLAGLSETDVAFGFLASPEYVRAHPSTDSYLQGLYADVLSRAPDPDGQAAWEAEARLRDSQEMLAIGFLTSPERDLRLVDQYYADLLRRPADPTGRQGWLRELDSPAGSPTLVAEAILASDEYFARAAASTPMA